ncbi:hypothetical protein AzCIB_4185 [Azoarcus sp. CIB]|nr:hypothetical protein AzCIB_4185 [Azoarcus sp. CIB]
MRGGEVAADLRDRARLGAGEPERQLREERPGELAVVAQDGRVPLAAGVVGAAQRQLLDQQFLELDALPGGMCAVLQRVRIDVGGRLVQRAQCFGRGGSCRPPGRCAGSNSVIGGRCSSRPMSLRSADWASPAVVG